MTPTASFEVGQSKSLSERVPVLFRSEK